jgi:Lactate racemase N-terminal domain
MIGVEAAGRCRLHVHVYDRDVVRMGRTSYGTPVFVNRVAAAADLLLGIGGIYPQHTTGFGGGSKLVLGVLGRQSIVALHYGHSSMAGSGEIHSSFRRDLDEIAAMVGLRTLASVHVDANREVVRMVTGDHTAYYREAVAYSLACYRAASPGDVDVVICNAYPQDVSLTFMRSKGLAPLLRARPSASRVVVSANSEGVGLHRLFPFLNGPPVGPVPPAGTPPDGPGTIGDRALPGQASFGRGRGAVCTASPDADPPLLDRPGPGGAAARGRAVAGQRRPAGGRYGLG